MSCFFLHCQKFNKIISAIKLDIKCIRFYLLAFLFHHCFTMWMMLMLVLNLTLYVAVCSLSCKCPWAVVVMLSLTHSPDNYSSGPGCSKLMTSLKFQKLLSQIGQYFLLKKCEKLLQCKSSSQFLSCLRSRSETYVLLFRRRRCRRQRRKLFCV